MIDGHVESGHILVMVQFRLENLTSFAVEFVVDTGFTEHLSLPREAIDAMKLPFRFETIASLADDSIVPMRVFDAQVMWNGFERDVSVIAAGKRPLLGTALLDGCELIAQFREGGVVSIDEL